MIGIFKAKHLHWLWDWGMESRYGCSERRMETSFSKSVTTGVLFFLLRLLLAFCAEEDQPLLHGLCEALPHFLPAEQLGLHLTWEHLPLSASPGGTLLRSVCCQITRLDKTIKKLNSISFNNGGLLPGCADGLCCRLTGPCFIKGLNEGRETRLVPTARRRSTINWKDISRCGSICCLQGPTFSL